MLSGGMITAQKYSDKDQVEVTKEWNGHQFSSTLSFLENIESVNEMSFLTEVLKDEAFKNKLDAEEMITIFAPLDQSFLKLTDKKRDSIINYSNGDLFRTIVKYHIVPGRIDRHSIKRSIEVNNGIAYFATLNGEKLGIKEINGALVLFDSNNNTSIIREGDFYHKNGLFHMVEGLVYPLSKN